jgi:hypothetical protein
MSYSSDEIYCAVEELIEIAQSTLDEDELLQLMDDIKGRCADVKSESGIYPSECLRRGMSWD